jgi:hypothetical protein
MAAQLQLTLQSDRGEDHLTDLTRQLSADLGRRPQFDVQEMSRPSQLGERSVGVALLGQLLLTLLTSGAAKALIDILRPYFERDHSLAVVLKLPDRGEVRIEGKDLRPDRLAEIMQVIKSLETPSA